MTKLFDVVHIRVSQQRCSCLALCAQNCCSRTVRQPIPKKRFELCIRHASAKSVEHVYEVVEVIVEFPVICALWKCHKFGCAVEVHGF